MADYQIVKWFFLFSNLTIQQSDNFEKKLYLIKFLVSVEDPPHRDGLKRNLTTLATTPALDTLTLIAYLKPVSSLLNLYDKSA